MAKRGTLEHPKTKRLARALDLPAWAALGLLEAFWHWVGRYAPTGQLTDEDILDCAETVRFDGDLANALFVSGWLDALDSGWYVHDWHDHADDTVKKTLAKRGETFANGSAIRKANDSRTVPTKDSESIPTHSRTVPVPFANDSRTDREQIANDSRQARALSHEPIPEPEDKYVEEEGCGEKPIEPSPPPSAPTDVGAMRKQGPKIIHGLSLLEWYGRFKDAYPKRPGNYVWPKAKERFDRLVLGGIDPAEIIAGAERYSAWARATGKYKTEFVKQPPTFLSERAWTEEWEIPDDAPNRRSTTFGAAKTLIDRLGDQVAL